MDKHWEGMYQKDKYARDRVIKSVRMLLPHLKKGDTVVDVGCFTQEAKKYLPSNVSYIGIDRVAYHKDNKIVDLQTTDLTLPEGQHIVCLETLEHLLQPKKCLQVIAASLPEDGHFLVSLPNEATAFHRIRCLFGTVDADAFQSGS